ncbi:glycosyltransferase [Phormidium tenue FACHB-886]|nr:glycosyltransferase [Phormidium tenue FACHB-886]
MTTKTVSVIMPCYNGERYLAEAIESVLNQTYSAAEIIVVDNASTDGSRAIIDRYSDRYSQVKCLSLSPNQGAAGARNQAIAKSSGEYIVMVDCDDRLLPHAIETGVNALNDHPEWMFAFGPCRLIDENGKPAQQGRKGLELPVAGSVYQTLLRGVCLNPFGRHIFRRALFDAIGYLDRSLRATDDYDFYLRAAAEFPCGSYDRPVVEYREHSNTLSQQTWTSKHLREVLAVYAKQQPFAQRNPEDAAAHREGLQQWCRLYSPYLSYDIVPYLKRGRLQEAGIVLYLTLRYYPQGLLTYVGTQFSKVIKPLQPLLNRA